MKCFPLIMLVASSCFGATLRGVVSNENGHHIASAEVTVFNEFSPVFVQVGKTDANGKYYFKVGAGVFRVIIVKKDYAPVSKRISIKKKESATDLTHTLVDLKDLDENHYAKILKSIYRQSNREPFRFLENGFDFSLSQTPNEPKDLFASLSSQSRTALNGSYDRRETVKLGSQISEQLTIESQLSRQHHALNNFETQYIDAGLHLEGRHGNLALKAETIQHLDSVMDGYSRSVGFSSDYGNRLRSRTGLQYQQSELSSEQHRQLGFQQEAAYKLGSVPIRQGVKLNEWHNNQETLGRKADLSAHMQPHPSSAWHFDADLQMLDLSNQSYRQATWRAKRVQAGTEHPWLLDNQIGWSYGDSGSFLVQKHQLFLMHTNIELAAVYEEDQTMEALSSFDIYGHYLSEPTMHFRLESFLRKQSTQTSLKLGIPHDGGWHSQLSWQDGENQTEVLLARQNVLNNLAEFHYQKWAYKLEVNPWGSLLEISHRQNKAAAADFSQVTLSISQWLRPFRDKTRGIMFALQMGNHPDMPHWWLLQETPWDTTSEDRWYEGQLRLQF